MVRLSMFAVLQQPQRIDVPERTAGRENQETHVGKDATAIQVVDRVP